MSMTYPGYAWMQALGRTSEVDPGGQCMVRPVSHMNSVNQRILK